MVVSLIRGKADAEEVSVEMTRQIGRSEYPTLLR